MEEENPHFRVGYDYEGSIQSIQGKAQNVIYVSNSHHKYNTQSHQETKQDICYYHSLLNEHVGVVINANSWVKIYLICSSWNCGNKSESRTDIYF